jgi:hypothetical protein
LIVSRIALVDAKTRVPENRRVLACAECGRVADHEASGWRAYREDLPGEDDPHPVAVFCPTCAAREFDPELAG